MGGNQYIVGRFAPPGRASRWIMRGLALIAFLPPFLLLGQLKEDTLVGCGSLAGFDCDPVLNGPWSRWLGRVPVIFGGMLVYGAMLVALCLDDEAATSRLRRTIWSLLTSLSVLAVGAAVWFITLQVFVIRSLCPYCMTTHISGLILASMVLFSLPIIRANRPSDHSTDDRFLSTKSAAWYGVAGVFGLGVLITGQLLVKPTTHEIVSLDPVPGETVEAVSTQDSNTPALRPSLVEAAPSSSVAKKSFGFLRDRLIVTPSTAPMIGPPDAPHVIAMMLDYTCKACRKAHDYIAQARHRYKGQLAVLILPAPLDSACNPRIKQTKPDHRGACEYARLALAVWKARPQVFGQFDHWLTKTERPPTLEAAHAKAEQLVDKRKLTEALADPSIDAIVRNNVRFHIELEMKRVPVVLTKSEAMVGKPASAEALFKFLEAKLGVVPSTQ